MKRKEKKKREVKKKPSWLRRVLKTIHEISATALPRDVDPADTEAHKKFALIWSRFLFRLFPLAAILASSATAASF